MRRPAAYGITGTLLGVILGAVFGAGTFFASLSAVSDYQADQPSSGHTAFIALAIAGAILALLVIGWAINCAVQLGRRLDAAQAPISGRERFALWSWIAVVLLPLLFLVLAFSYNQHLEHRKQLRAQASKEIRSHYNRFAGGQFHIPEDGRTLTLTLDFDGPHAGEYKISGRTFDCSRQPIDVSRTVQLPAGPHQEVFVMPGAWSEGKYDPRDGRREWDQRVGLYFELEPKLLPADVARLRELDSRDGRLEWVDRQVRIGAPVIPCSAEPPEPPKPASPAKPATGTR